MRRVFKTRTFTRLLRKSGKKRVALPGQGKRGSARTLIATNRGSRWFFVYGYEKNVRANISAAERDALMMLAHDLLTMSPAKLDAAVQQGDLQEICGDASKTP